MRRIDGNRAPFVQILARELVRLGLGAVPFVGLLDVLWPLWDARNQTIHDKVGSVVVIRTRRLTGVDAEWEHLRQESV